MKGQDLIAQANRLVRASTNKPRRADLNRAVSAAYYALFLTLARLCADTIAGTGKNRNIAAWQQAYRAVLMSVDLPEPDGPQTTTTSPFSTLVVQLVSTVNAP